MSRVLFAIAFVIAGTSWFAGESQAEAAGLRGIVIVDAINLAPKVPKAHERLTTRLQRALSAKSWITLQVVPGTQCATPADCLPSLARQVGSQFVLRITGDRNEDDGYNFAVELYQTSTASTQTTRAYCDYCTVERMADVAGRTAVDMLANAVAEDAAQAKRKQEQPAPLPPPAAAPPPLARPPVMVRPLVVEPPPPLPTVEPKRRSWIPWTFIGVGAVAVSYGVWGLARNGSSAGCSPTRVPSTCDHYSSQAVGIASLLGGIAFAGTGVGWLIIEHSSSTEVSLSPNHVALNVRF